MSILLLTPLSCCYLLKEFSLDSNITITTKTIHTCIYRMSCVFHTASEFTVRLLISMCQPFALIARSFSFCPHLFSLCFRSSARKVVFVFKVLSVCELIKKVYSILVILKSVGMWWRLEDPHRHMQSACLRRAL